MLTSIGSHLIHYRQLRRSAWLVIGLCFSLIHPSAAPVSSDLQIPDLGDASSSLISAREEYHLGRAWLMVFRSQAPIVSDPLLADYLEHLVYRLASFSQLQDRRLELVIIDNKDMNAFAVPGGVIGIHNGLFLHALNEDQFASVLSHELAHLSQRHFARGVENRKSASITNLATLLGALIIAATAGGDAGMAAIAASQAAAMDNQLRFSRQNEQEADRIGLLTMINANYDPMAVSAMFEQMQRSSRLYSRPPEFLLTHPVTERRISDARSRAARLPKKQPGDNFEYHLMRARVLVHVEQNTRVSIRHFENLIAEGQVHQNASRYGLVLALTNAGRLDEGQQQLDKLLASDPLQIPYQIAQADLWLQHKQPQKAKKLLQRQLRYNPGNYPLTMNLYEALISTGETLAAAQLLSTHIKYRPSDPHIWYELAEIRGLTGDIIGVHRARAEYFLLMGAPDTAITQLGYALQMETTDDTSAARIRQRILEIQAWMAMMEFK